MSARFRMPTVSQVLTLPRLLSAKVTDEFEDANGHLNVTGYLALHDQAAWPWLAALDMDPSTSIRPHGLMDLEHHLRYLAEVHVGDQVAVHGQFLERSERRIHGLWYLVNMTRHQLSNTLEFVSVHVDLDRRSAADFGDETSAALDIQIGDTIRDWPPPVSGTMGL